MWHDVLTEHDRRCDDMVARHGGTVVGYTGDGIVATFDGASAAIRAARDISQAMVALDVEVRAGVHTGEVRSRTARAAG